MPTYLAECRCGQVALEATGPHIVNMSCYCDDCQEAAGIIDALDNGCSGIEADGGTPNILFRRDRVRWLRGETLLTIYKVREISHTNRLVASCCNTAITQRHDNWWPHRGIKTHLFKTPLPALEMRMFLKYAPDRSVVPKDVRHARTATPGLAYRLLREALAVRGVPRPTI